MPAIGSREFGTEVKGLHLDRVGEVKDTGYGNEEKEEGAKGTNYPIWECLLDTHSILFRNSFFRQDLQDLHDFFAFPASVPEA